VQNTSNQVAALQKGGKYVEKQLTLEEIFLAIIGKKEAQ